MIRHHFYMTLLTPIFIMY